MRSLFLVQVAGLLFFTMSIPVEIVFVKHSLHAGTKAYGALLSAWGAGTVAGSATYARWRTATLPTWIVSGSTVLGLGFVLMAVSPSLGLAIAGAVLAGIGNGVWAVAARTALQEHVEDSWMALVMSFNESIFQFMPGVGIAVGGAVAALAGPRVALAAGGAGALAVAAGARLLLRPRRAAVTVA